MGISSSTLSLIVVFSFGILAVIGLFIVVIKMNVFFQKNKLRDNPLEKVIIGMKKKDFEKLFRTNKESQKTEIAHEGNHESFYYSPDGKDGKKYLATFEDEKLINFREL